MATETTYLELSDQESHKFYEVTVDGAKLVVRYGRIGDPGQSTTTTLASADAARAEAAKKLGEKRKKGYAPATLGATAKRAVTHRSALLAQAQTRSPKGPKAHGAPLLWSLHTKASALGIHIGQGRYWVGNQLGDVIAFDHAHTPLAHFKLPEGVKCIVADEGLIYAGCDDGNVYDLSGRAPRVAYRIAANVDIYWLDIHYGSLVVSDAAGHVSAFDHEQEPIFAKKSRGDKGWMVRCDAGGVYHGHSKGRDQVRLGRRQRDLVETDQRLDRLRLARRVARLRLDGRRHHSLFYQKGRGPNRL